MRCGDVVSLGSLKFSLMRGAAGLAGAAPGTGHQPCSSPERRGVLIVLQLPPFKQN